MNKTVEKNITKNITKKITITGDWKHQLFNNNNKNLEMIEKRYRVKLTGRGDLLSILGDLEKVESVERLVNEINKLSMGGYSLQKNDFGLILRLFEEKAHPNLKDIFSSSSAIVTDKKTVSAKSIIQKEYLNAIERYNMVFGVGPAGTGKTYLAVSMAVSFLLKKRVSKIILTRPAVEAGEKLGFLPGDLSEKVNPYLRPLYDALYDMMEPGKITNLVEQEIIEIAPLAFMRGRTLNNAFIILDEAQNSTPEQMKMFLTRTGFNSKVVVTGDITQTDLPENKDSGLIEARKVLNNIKEIRFISFSEKDVVRNNLVRLIINAYDESQSEKQSN